MGPSFSLVFPSVCPQVRSFRLSNRPEPNLETRLFRAWGPRNSSLIPKYSFTACLQVSVSPRSQVRFLPSFIYFLPTNLLLWLIKYTNNTVRIGRFCAAHFVGRLRNFFACAFWTRLRLISPLKYNVKEKEHLVLSGSVCTEGDCSL